MCMRGRSVLPLQLITTRECVKHIITKFFVFALALARKTSACSTWEHKSVGGDRESDLISGNRSAIFF